VLIVYLFIYLFILRSKHSMKIMRAQQCTKRDKKATKKPLYLKRKKNTNIIQYLLMSTWQRVSVSL